jgi:cell division septation protein DedD
MKKNKKVSLSKKPFLVLSRRAIAGWLGVIFLLCAWMFVVGILVGRGTAPVKFKIDGLESKLEIPGQKDGREPEGQDQGELGLAEDKTRFDFYEALPEDRQDTTIDEKKPAPNISKKVEPSPPQNPPPTYGEKTPPENKLKKQADPKAGFKKKQPAKQPVAAKSEVEPSGKIYTVQVAAVKVAKDADRLVAQLKKKGYPAFRTISKVKDKGIWFRVRVGKYKSRAEASSTLKKLNKSDPRLKPIVVEK